MPLPLEQRTAQFLSGKTEITLKNQVVTCPPQTLLWFHKSELDIAGWQVTLLGEDDYEQYIQLTDEQMNQLESIVLGWHEWDCSNEERKEMLDDIRSDANVYILHGDDRIDFSA